MTLTAEQVAAAVAATPSRYQEKAMECDCAKGAHGRGSPVITLYRMPDDTLWLGVAVIGPERVRFHPLTGRPADGRRFETAVCPSCGHMWALAIEDPGGLAAYPLGQHLNEATVRWARRTTP